MLFLLNSILVLNSYAYYFYLSLSSISNKWCRNILFVINSGQSYVCVQLLLILHLFTLVSMQCMQSDIVFRNYICPPVCLSINVGIVCKWVHISHFFDSLVGASY